MRRRALLVAVQRFDDRALATLRKPEADVLSLSRVLRVPALAGFEVGELIDPTLTAFRTAVFDLFDGSRVNSFQFMPDPTALPAAGR